MPSCENCSQSFQISQDDLDFYQKVSPTYAGKTCLIPPPTFCPACRNGRRMAWRNDRSFYLRLCDLTGDRIVSIYPEHVPFPVYEHTAWYSDRWDPMDFGQELDLSLPFFDQWAQLMKRVPRLNLDLVNCQNSDYCNYCGDDKNCYLDIAGEANEDCYYNLFTKYSKNCADCTFVYHSTLCHDSVSCYNCYNVRSSMYLDNCSDCSFCYDLKGCKNCLFSINLRNKEYYIFNEPFSKEEYLQKLEEFDLGSYESTRSLEKQWQEFRLEKGIYRDMYLLNCENCFGNNIKNSRNCYSVFNATDCEDSMYLYDVLNAKDCRDLNYSLYDPQVSYELISTLQLQYSAFNMATHYSSEVFYCSLVNNSQHLFGCIGLNRKSYCILNKQYSKEEYERLVPRLVAMMEEKGEWGEFFPASLSPFGYNETVAQEYQPLTKEIARQKGYEWKDQDARDSKPQSVATPDHIREVSQDILKELLSCRHCEKNFRIIPQELEFYRKENIPLPRNCPDCRHLHRMNLRNPRQLFKRSCSNCDRSIQTTYAPEREERVFCEECYLEVVY